MECSLTLKTRNLILNITLNQWSYRPWPVRRTRWSLAVSLICGRECSVVWITPWTGVEATFDHWVHVVTCFLPVAWRVTAACCWRRCVCQDSRAGVHCWCQGAICDVSLPQRWAGRTKQHNSFFLYCITYSAKLITTVYETKLCRHLWHTIM
jgi:hypothetical protein